MYIVHIYILINHFNFKFNFKVAIYSCKKGSQVCGVGTRQYTIFCFLGYNDWHFSDLDLEKAFDNVDPY